jgi:hypothetical protein
MLMKSAVFWGITWCRVVIVYRRFVTTYRSHPHGPRVQVITPRNTPEDRRFYKNTYFVFSKCFPKILPFMMYVQYGRARQGTDDRIIRHRKDAVSLPDK